jgi:hypothetical protein
VFGLVSGLIDEIGETDQTYESHYARGADAGLDGAVLVPLQHAGILMAI